MNKEAIDIISTECSGHITNPVITLFRDGSREVSCIFISPEGKCGQRGDSCYHLNPISKKADPNVG